MAVVRELGKDLGWQAAKKAAPFIAAAAGGPFAAFAVKTGLTTLDILDKIATANDKENLRRAKQQCCDCVELVDSYIKNSSVMFEYAAAHQGCCFWFASSLLFHKQANMMVQSVANGGIVYRFNANTGRVGCGANGLQLEGCRIHHITPGTGK